MNKLLLLLALLALVVYSQPPEGPGGPNGGGTNGGGSSNQGSDDKGAPPTPTPGEGNEEMQMAMMAMVEAPPENWYCDFEFYINGQPYFYENLSYDETEAYYGKFAKKYDNKIDSVYWSGTRCYCWVVFYQTKYWDGLNLGLWIDSESGYYDLSKYITYDFDDHRWETWSTVVSSYSIYCY